MERIVPSPGITVAGHEIAPGTIVSVPYSVAHRDLSIWGQDANIFRPERWLDQDPVTLKKMEQSFLAVSPLIPTRHKHVQTNLRSLGKVAVDVRGVSWECSKSQLSW